MMTENISAKAVSFVVDVDRTALFIQNALEIRLIKRHPG